jgi:hypothetical protein
VSVLEPSAIRLEVMSGGVTYAVALTPEPLTIGRAPSNRLSLTDPGLSWLHAVVRVADGRVWIRDLDSTNGVFLDGARIRGEVLFPAQSTVRLGSMVTLGLSATARSAEAAHLVLEDLQRGRRHALLPGRVELASLEIARAGALAVTLDGRVTLWREDQPRDLTLGLVYHEGGGAFRIVLADHAATVGHGDEPWPYRMTVRLNGPQGPTAELVDRPTGRVCLLTAETRVVLLYLLGRRAVLDREARARPEDAGWCPDDELEVGLWGKGQRSASTLPVLVHRLRKDLEASGFDSGFLEKGRRVLRARLVDIHLEESAS